MHPDRVNTHLYHVITHYMELRDRGPIATIAEAGVRIRHLPFFAVQ